MANVNREFGELVKIERLERAGENYRYLFRCSCGNEKSMLLHSAKVTGHCGCQTKRRLAARHRTHGMSATKIYKVWAGMLDRCRNKNHTAYQRYGGRGIRVCAEWTSFEGFYSDMKDGYSEGLTIERVDNELGYIADNCVWATRSQQSQNLSNTNRYKYKGEPMTITEISRVTGLARGTVIGRIRRGWSIEKLIETKRLKQGAKK